MRDDDDEAPKLPDFDRDRRGKEAFGDAEIVARLKRIRDGSIEWLEECVVEGVSKGSATADLVFRNTQAELERIEDRLIAQTAEPPKFTWAPCAPDGEEPEKKPDAAQTFRFAKTKVEA